MRSSSRVIALLLASGLCLLLFPISIYGLEVHAGYICSNAPRWMRSWPFVFAAAGVFWSVTLGMIPLSAYAVKAARANRQFNALASGLAMLAVAWVELVASLLMVILFVAVFFSAIILGLVF